jgi:hypothetical protein
MSDGHYRLLDRADAAISESKALIQDLHRILRLSRRRGAMLRMSAAKDRADIELARSELRRVLQARAKLLKPAAPV